MVVYDNGPQFSAEVYAGFALAYQFTHKTSSLYDPQSNGEAERAVGTVKQLLKKESDPYLDLLAYRSTPLQSGFCPSELLISSKLCTTVPIKRSQRIPEVPDKQSFEKKVQILKYK